MAIWTKYTVHIETVDAKQMEIVRKADMERIGWGAATGANKLILDWSESLRSFDCAKVLARIASILKGMGTAYIIADCDEDIPVCTTYYYLGDGVKSVTFSAFKGMKFSEDTQWALCTENFFCSILGALSDLELIKLIARKGTVGYRSTKLRYDDNMQKILDCAAFDYYQVFRELTAVPSWFLDDITPDERKLFEPVFDKNKRKYEDRDFVPNLNWEQKGIAKFTKIERERLKNNTTVLTQKTLPRSKRLVKDIVRALVSEEPVIYDAKTFVVDGDATGIYAERIMAKGGKIGKKVQKKTDYLALNLNTNSCLISKFADYLDAKENDGSIRLITLDMIGE